MAKELHPVISARIFGARRCFGPGVAELLRRVDTHRSLRAAAQSMEMAYSKAWTITKTAEAELGFKLLSSSTGGKNGGGAALTDDARRLLDAYDAYCAELRAFGERLFAEKFPFLAETEGRDA